MCDVRKLFLSYYTKEQVTKPHNNSEKNYVPKYVETQKKSLN